MTAITPTKAALKAAYAATEVDRLHEMEPAKASAYLRERADYLDSGKWAPNRAALLREQADLIDAAIAEENDR